MENIIIRALVNLSEHRQLADTYVVVPAFNMGIKVPRHIYPCHLQLGSDLLLCEPGTVPQLAEVGSDAKILLDFLIHAYTPIRHNVWQSTQFGLDYIGVFVYNCVVYHSEKEE